MALYQFLLQVSRHLFASTINSKKHLFSRDVVFFYLKFF
ncbi:hypothetical protein ISR11_1677 [Streptococcus pyogenes]|nr:hypothetical protein ISR11_1677 [Streptococcus pyogenes]